MKLSPFDIDNVQCNLLIDLPVHLGDSSYVLAEISSDIRINLNPFIVITNGLLGIKLGHVDDLLDLVHASLARRRNESGGLFARLGVVLACKELTRDEETESDQWQNSTLSPFFARL